uniref:inositol-3-phosphate synthase n=1 Tax=Petromyzon marinus TaxID=7757 RepID=S4RK66_PETMA
MAEMFQVQSPNVRYTEEHIEAVYQYQTSHVARHNGRLIVSPQTKEYEFRTRRHVPRLGVMLVGWGGNNGSTVTAATIANRLGLSWNTKTGVKHANYFGSVFQSSTVSLGSGPQGDVFIPFRDLLPMVHPNDIVFDGWDISSLNLAEAMRRAEVLDWGLQEQLRPHMEKLRPRASIYVPEFIAANQEDRANNLIPGTKAEQLEQLRRDIRDFKASSGVEKVIVMWTANTERFCEVAVGLNDTSDSLMKSIARNESEVSPSSLFAVASILEGCAYINGSPQNTFVPGVLELATQRGVFVGGDDFKSGQTKLKSVLVDFLVSAGMKKTVSIVSYNHLGNNDGSNNYIYLSLRLLTSESIKNNHIFCFVHRSIAVNAAPNLVAAASAHAVVIKYVPYVGDSKRAMDEYTSEIMMGGLNTLVIHNTCEVTPSPVL